MAFWEEGRQTSVAHSLISPSLLISIARKFFVVIKELRNNMTIMGPLYNRAHVSFKALNVILKNVNATIFYFFIYIKVASKC